MKNYKIFLIGLFLIMNSFTIHKFYMSLTHINFIKSKETVQITLRVFIDDLREELNTSYKTKKIELATDREPINIDSLYQSFLKKNFKIYIDQKDTNIEYIGKVYNDDMVVFYLEIPGIKEINTINIQNYILCNLHPEQENIIKTNINNKQKSHILTNDNESIIIYY